MPLNWSIAECREPDTLLCDTYIDPSQNGSAFAEGTTNDQRNQHRITTSVIQMMPNLGINKITSDNMYEVAERYHILSTGDDNRVGVWEEHEGELVYRRMRLNTLHFADRIGLSTNVTNMTRSGWVADLRDGYAVDNWMEVGDCWDRG